MDTLQERLLSWYEEHKRDLPWRNTEDPYNILVSEVMLQQTQVSRVIPKYREFVDAFPTVEALAAASLKDVLTVWDGLGFNRRAKFLKESAEIIVNKYGGEVPRDVDTLQELPGVGTYTAQAVAAFAFNRGDAPVFDTNVQRLLYRFHGHETDTELQAVHQELFDENHPRKWNNAVMELGSQVCTTGTPHCKTCPWREDCAAWKRKDFSEPEKQTQSPFPGSWRQYRATLLRLLMDGPRTREEIREELDLPGKYDVEELLVELAGEDLIVHEQKKWRLPS